jgi:hypothetical protein
MTTSTDAALHARSTPSLSSILQAGGSRAAIRDHLDGLSAADRLAEVLAVKGKHVGRLYDAVAGGEPLTLADFVPVGERGTVIFEGRNSLPAFSRFQKRFARVGDVLIGYNHQQMSFATGPGYFTVREATPGETQPDELFFDYTMDPPGVPLGWPRFVRNDQGLSRAVYMNMKDFCRTVATGVLVGKAYKLGVEQGAFFTLTRAI